MKVNAKQMEAVLALPGPRRFEHFVKVVGDWQQVWGLYRDGWALTAVEDNASVFPLWPAKEYAQICAAGEWAGHEPSAISLDTLMDELLPALKHDGVLVGVFFTPSGKGVTVPTEELAAALGVELQNYQ
ncbi:DUF2750 domain-containing protein [Kaistia terrae]|uniref:DUF2750 domain-containing protein n=1 Tax=Kaistia terrae TaxID=537017 RepID=A0ABW0PZY3_9HYPH|nr:DUF2750 domain-containing protein [Kaistia terrae]MCX5580477.1 DUF2750 domain-containing protein [Kaistia terrae]